MLYSLGGATEKSETTMAATDSVREKALHDYRKKLLEHKELEARLKESKKVS